MHFKGVKKISVAVIGRLLPLIFVLWLSACGDSQLNNPHTAQKNPGMVYYSSFDLPPKHLDPAVSYSSIESLFLSQIYESPLGYHFLKRPYELSPTAASRLPEVDYLNEARELVTADSGEVAFTRYTIHLKPDLHFQPHPAFAKNEYGKPLYLFGSAEETEGYKSLEDFSEVGSRPAVSNDFIYQIKRLSDAKNKSPMLGFMGRYIVGMKELTQQLRMVERETWLNLDDYQMEGLQQIDEQSYSILVYGHYPQFIYWLAMSFFTATAPEVDRFYENPGFKAKNLTLDWHPVGTGPYMMTKNDPNSEIILEKNPNFHAEYYPSEGSEEDRENGFLNDSGKRLPFIDKAIYKLEKSALPRWTKFLQGYYDRSGENHSNTTGVFDQAFTVGPEGLELTEDMSSHQLTISEAQVPVVYYYGFNMRDSVVGGYTEKARKLRQALSIAYNQEDYSDIFYKGMALPAQGPLPPGIAGHIEGKAGINPYVYDWVDGEPRRKSIEIARQLLAEAGYPNGRKSETGEPLKIYLDVQSQAIGNAQMDWIRRQMQHLGVQVEFRAADFNRTQEKLLTGNAQIFSLGWGADYPDPENFLFLFYSQESPLVCRCDGANNGNYENPEFDKLFVQMRSMQPGDARDELVVKMVEMVRKDALWMSSYYTREFFLNNPWVFNARQNGMTRNSLRYMRLDSKLRDKFQKEWNKAVVWPVIAGLMLFIAIILPAVRAYRKRQRSTISMDVPR